MNSNLDVPEAILAAIAQEVAKDAPSTDRLVALSAELSKRDTSSVRFTVDADHVNRLGVELVSRQESAVAELVKNAYDADSVKVYLTFSEVNRIGSSIVIQDNGLGMSEAELINGFMRISTQDKKNNVLSKKYERRRAGKKGIGRFAAQRLGHRLELITKREEDDFALKVNIDWDKFSAEKELVAVSNVIETLPGYSEFPYGTRLSIFELRDEWSEAQIKRAHRNLANILQPFPLSKVKGEGVQDPGFSFEIRKREGLVDELLADDSVISDCALAEISAWVDDKGLGFWRVKSEYLKFDSGPRNYKTITPKEFEERPEFAPLGVKNVHFVAHYFIRNDDHIPKNFKRIINNVLKEYGGVRLYRNGFRVLPYGERFDDWLRLNEYTQVRKVLPQMSTGNFIGFVELGVDTEGDFEEVASREGLMATESFEELREFIGSAIMSAVVEIAHQRGDRKLFAGQKNYNKDAPKSREEERDELSARLDSLLESVEEDAEEGLFLDVESDSEEKYKTDGDEEGGGENNAESSSSEFEQIRGAVKDLNTFVDVLLKENELYRVVAALGLSMAEFTHEVRFHLHDTMNCIADLSQTVGVDQSYLQKLQKNFDNLKDYTSFYEESFRSLSLRSLEVIDLRYVVNEFSNTLNHNSKLGDGVIIRTIFSGKDFFTAPSHISNVNSILVNLYSNAKKAILRVGAEKPEIEIRLVESEEVIELHFSDKGDGIAIENEEKVFDAFFTHSSQEFVGANESQQVMGMGLGLSIVKQIVLGMNGHIYVSEPLEGFSTTIIVTLPKATSEELPDDLY